MSLTEKSIPAKLAMLRGMVRMNEPAYMSTSTSRMNQPVREKCFFALGPTATGATGWATAAAAGAAAWAA